LQRRVLRHSAEKLAEGLLALDERYARQVMAIEVNKVERDEYELLGVAGGKRLLEGRKARHPGRLLNYHLPVENRFLQFEAVEDGGKPPVVARPIEAVARDQASYVDERRAKVR
jgi:hypothetical protein